LLRFYCAPYNLGSLDKQQIFVLAGFIICGLSKHALFIPTNLACPKRCNIQRQGTTGAPIQFFMR
jgi:hypothetical protein